MILMPLDSRSYRPAVLKSGDVVFTLFFQDLNFPMVKPPFSMQKTRFASCQMENLKNSQRPCNFYGGSTNYEFAADV